MLVKGIPGLNELVINYFIRLCDQKEIPFIPYDESYWMLQQLWFDDSGALPTGEKQPARQANTRGVETIITMIAHERYGVANHEQLEYLSNNFSAHN